MTRRRWIADDADLTRNCAALTGANAAHLARVLRAKVGQEFDIALPGNSPIVRRGLISSIAEDRIEFLLAKEVSLDTPRDQITLLLAVFKFDRMEWAIEKATELGVARIVPVLASRTEKNLAAAAEKRIERWQRIVHEAAQQSRRASLLEITAPQKLKSALEGTHGIRIRIVLAESEKQISLTEALSSANSGSPAALAIGPEGGWTTEEMQLFTESGWHSATLGPTILRAETAAIAALAIAFSRLQSPIEPRR